MSDSDSNEWPHNDRLRRHSDPTITRPESRERFCGPLLQLHIQQDSENNYGLTSVPSLSNGGWSPTTDHSFERRGFNEYRPNLDENPEHFLIEEPGFMCPINSCEKQLVNEDQWVNHVMEHVNPYQAPHPQPQFECGFHSVSCKLNGYPIHCGRCVLDVEFGSPDGSWEGIIRHLFTHVRENAEEPLLLQDLSPDLYHYLRCAGMYLHDIASNYDAASSVYSSPRASVISSMCPEQGNISRSQRDIVISQALYWAHTQGRPVPDRNELPNPNEFNALMDQLGRT